MLLTYFRLLRTKVEPSPALPQRQPGLFLGRPWSAQDGDVRHVESTKIMGTTTVNEDLTGFTIGFQNGILIHLPFGNQTCQTHFPARHVWLTEDITHSFKFEIPPIFGTRKWIHPTQDFWVVFNTTQRIIDRSNMYIYIFSYMHTYIDTYIHTLHYSTVQYNTLQYITLQHSTIQ